MNEIYEKIRNADQRFTQIKIDVGLSHNAPNSIIWMQNEPSTFVLSIEPNPKAVYPMINGFHPISRYLNLGQCVLGQFALSNVSGMMDFYVNRHDCGTSSLYFPNTDIFGEIDCVVKTPVYCLRDVFDSFPWERFSCIDHVKIDAQGSDLDILKGAGSYLSNRVVYATAEADGYQYQGAHHCSEENICDYMTSQGFVRVKHPNTVDPTFLNLKFQDKKDIQISQI